MRDRQRGQPEDDQQRADDRAGGVDPRIRGVAHEQREPREGEHRPEPRQPAPQQSAHVFITCRRGADETERGVGGGTGVAPRIDVATKPIWKIEVGDQAPGFELLATGDTAGKGQPMRRIRLADYREKKNVMIAFYPAAFTPV